MQNRRYDILPISYGISSIKIKNDEIKLFHPDGNADYKLNGNIVFRGHSHISKFIDSSHVNNKGVYVYVPTLSDLYYDKNTNFPSIYDITFLFGKNGYIKEMNVSVLVFINGKFIKVSEYLHKFDSVSYKNMKKNLRF